MSHYRLLRDNKETGPFSEEEMIAKGFKPYDLIWVEGKSAGWRYPSEIAAFKSFAPIVEEQPYDRFYKKQPPQKLFIEEQRNSPSPVAPVVAIKQQLPPDYSIQSLPGRHINVILPFADTVNLTTAPVAKKQNSQINKINNSIEVNKIYAPSEFTESIVTAQRPSAKEAATAAVLPGSVDISETRYTSKQQWASSQPIAGFSWSLIAAAFIGIATLVGLGIMIGLSMNRDRNDIAFNEALLNKFKRPAILPVAGNGIQSLTENTFPTEPAATVSDEVLQSRSSSFTNKAFAQNAVVKNTVAAGNDINENKKLQAERNAPVTDKPSGSQDESVVHTRPAPVVINVEKNLSLTANAYKKGPFGGISKLKCTLVNGSKIPLASVEVEVDYILANNKIFKTVTLLFRDVSAGAQVTVDAPSSNRGIKISSRIIKINTRETGLSNNTAKS